MTRSFCCTVLLLGSIFVPVAVAGCEGKGGTSPSNKDAGAPSRTEKGDTKPTPPERDPG